MGVKGLYTHLRCFRHDIYTTTLPATPKLRIGFDAMSILYKYKSAWPDMLPLLQDLLEQGHRVLFVFDGKAPAEKEEEVKERREARTDASTQAATLKTYLASGAEISAKERKVLEFSVARLEHQGWYMTRETRHDVQGRLWKMGIPCVKANGEADDVLTDLVGAKKLDVVVSTDMDFLLSGVERLWIPGRNEGGSFEEILMPEVLAEKGVTEAGFLDAGILCGVEPLRGQPNVATETAFRWIGYYKSMEALLASSVQNPLLEYFRTTPTELERVRAHFRPQEPWSARIRADHFEKARTFLEAL